MQMGKTVALVFAGGTGQRMNSKTRPKQFLELHGKPILVHTLERFESSDVVDGIVVVCLEPWIPFLQKQVTRYDLTKVVDIVPGGNTGQESIGNGISCIADSFPPNTAVLIHDGVRPLVDSETIIRCVNSVREHGNAITVVPAIETIICENKGKVEQIIDRSSCCLARAPQCFLLGDLVDAHKRAFDDDNLQFIDTASLMMHYGHTLHTVPGNMENIKITTPSDFYIFRAMVDARENSYVFGY